MILIAGIAELCALFRHESDEDKAKRAQHMRAIHVCINTLSRAFLDQEPVDTVKISNTMVSHMKAANLDFMRDEPYKKFGLKGVDDFLLLEQGLNYTNHANTIQSIQDSIQTIKTSGIKRPELNEDGRQLLQDNLDKFRTPSTLLFIYIDEMGRLPQPMKQRMAKASALIDHLAEMKKTPATIDELLATANKALTLVQDTRGEIFSLITARQSNQVRQQKQEFTL